MSGSHLILVICVAVQAFLDVEQAGEIDILISNADVIFRGAVEASPTRTESADDLDPATHEAWTYPVRRG